MWKSLIPLSSMLIFNIPYWYQFRPLFSFLLGNWTDENVMFIFCSNISYHPLAGQFRKASFHLSFLLLLLLAIPLLPFLPLLPNRPKTRLTTNVNIAKMMAFTTLLNNRIRAIVCTRWAVVQLITAGRKSLNSGPWPRLVGCRNTIGWVEDSWRTL